MKFSKKLINAIIHTKESIDHSLIHGKSGILLALAYYYKYECLAESKNEIKVHIDTCINALLNTLSEEAMDGSLASGVTGISYALRAAHDMGLQESIEDEWFLDLDEIIIEFLENQLNKKEYDLFRGASGSVVYLLQFGLNIEPIKRYVHSLFENAIWDTKTSCFWIFFSFNENKQILEYREDIVNLGLAHGMTGIISILSSIYKLGIEKEKVSIMLTGAINYVLREENPQEISLFNGIKYVGKKQQNSSRLGWCYGDLGVGFSILKAGTYCNNLAWVNKGNSICLKTLSRNIEDAGLDEHGICHGYFGTMHMYNRVYNFTGNPEYIRGIKYWYKAGMEQRDFSIHNSGFFQVDYEHNRKLRKYNTSGLLLGLAGVYLSLASVKNMEYPWDAAFLLDTN